VGVERMLRIYFLQQWFNLSDPAVEETLYDLVLMRQFVGIDLGREHARLNQSTCLSASPAHRSAPLAGL
jgi:IS5 family transposase